MRAIVFAAALGTLHGYMARAQVGNAKEACPATQHQKQPFARCADTSNGFESIFEITAVRSLTPAAHQTRAAARTFSVAKDQEAKTFNDAVNYSLARAAMRPFLATLNASAARQRSTAFEGGSDAELSALDELETPQMQILKRVPVENQSFKPHRLFMALVLSVMMAAYGWRMGSSSGLKCCVLLLFLVSFHLRSMHDILV